MGRELPAADAATVLPSGFGSAFSRPKRYRREFTPSWLELACTLHGRRGPRADGDLAVVHVQSSGGLTPCVIAANDPRHHVTVVDDDPGVIEEIEGLVRAGDLGNVDTVEASPGGAPLSIAGPIDVLLLDDVMSTWPDATAVQLLRLARRVRAGGHVVVAYRTTVGWAELLPLRSVLRRRTRLIADTDERRSAAVECLRDLVAMEPSYVTERERLATMLSEILADPGSGLVEELLVPELRTFAAGTMIRLLRGAGCSFVGSALLGDRGQHALEPWQRLLDDALDERLRETMRDIASPVGVRVDIYRRGRSAIATTECRRLLGRWRYSSIASDPVGAAADESWSAPMRDLLERLMEGPASIAAHSVRAEVVVDVARALHAGLIHPRSCRADREGVPTRGASVPIGGGLWLAFGLGSAIPLVEGLEPRRARELGVS